MVGLWQPGFTTHHGSLRISHMMWNLNRNGVMVYPQRDRDDSWRWIERQLGPHLVSQVDGRRQLKQSEKRLSRIKSVLGCQQSLSKCDWSPQQSSHDSHLSSASLQKPQAQGKQEKTNSLLQSLWHFPNIRGQAPTTPVFGYPCTTQFVPSEIQRSTGTFDQWFSRISCSFHLRVLNPHHLDSLLLKSPSCQSTLLVCRQNPFVLKRRTPHLPSLKYHQDFSQSNPCFIIFHCYLFHTHCLPSGAKEKMAQSRSLIYPLIDSMVIFQFVM